MPTKSSMPSLETTQALGATLLHQFARERFGEAGFDASFIREAENREHLDLLASKLLIEEGGDLESSRANSFNETSDSVTTCQVESNPDDKSIYHSMNISDGQPIASPFDRLLTSPCFTSYGCELRKIADEFERSRLRKAVKDRADLVTLSDITKVTFQKLLEELFEGRITREKIVILFFFCTDVALRAVSFTRELVVKLLGWSFSYLVERFCNFIHGLGGWGKVLNEDMGSLLNAKLDAWIRNTLENSVSTVTGIIIGGVAVVCAMALMKYI